MEDPIRSTAGNGFHYAEVRAAVAHGVQGGRLPGELYATQPTPVQRRGWRVLGRNSQCAMKGAVSWPYGNRSRSRPGLGEHADRPRGRWGLAGDGGFPQLFPSGRATIRRLAGFDARSVINAFGAVLGQLSGTTEAYVEVSAMRAMQVGFGSRNTIVVWGLARLGVIAP